MMGLQFQGVSLMWPFLQLPFINMLIKLKTDNTDIRTKNSNEQMNEDIKFNASFSCATFEILLNAFKLIKICHQIKQK